MVGLYRADGWHHKELYQDENLVKSVELPRGVYFVGDIYFLFKQTDRQMLDTYVFTGAALPLEGDLSLFMTRTRETVIFDTLENTGIQPDTTNHLYHLARTHPGIGITEVPSGMDPTPFGGHLVTSEEPFICSCYEFLEYGEDDGFPFLRRIIDFGAHVKFDVTGRLPYEGMSMESDDPRPPVRYQRGQRITKAVRDISNFF